MTKWWKAAPWLLALSMMVLYSPALSGEILDWDDPIWVLDPLVRLPLSEAIPMAFGSPRDHAWYPLLRLTWWIQHAVFGPNPVWMHAVNLGLFSGAILLLHSLLKRLGLDPRTAFVATALWAVHPSRVESVAWLTSRKDLLSLVALLVAAHLFSSGRNLLASVCFGIACLSKAAVFPLAGVFLLLNWARRRPLSDASVMLGLGGAVALFGLLLYNPNQPNYPYNTWGENLQFVVGLEGSWWRRLFAIDGLAAIQPLPNALWPDLIGGSLCLAGAGALAWSAGRWGAVLFSLWLLPLLPVHGLVPMTFWAADRHLLLPSIAVAVAVAVAGSRWLRWWVPLVLLLPLSWKTHQRIPDWHDSLTLWTADASRPGTHWSRDLKLGTALGRAGRFDEAVQAFRRAEALEPGRDDLLARRLLAELASDGWSKQDAALAKGLQPPPKSPEQWSQIAAVLLRMHHPSACDASRQAQQHGGALDPACR